MLNSVTFTFPIVNVCGRNYSQLWSEHHIFVRIWGDNMIIKMVYYLKRRNISLLACRLIRSICCCSKCECNTIIHCETSGIILVSPASCRKGTIFLDFVTYSMSSQYPALLAALGEKLAKQNWHKAYCLRLMKLKKKYSGSHLLKLKCYAGISWFVFLKWRFCWGLTPFCKVRLLRRKTSLRKCHLRCFNKFRWIWPLEIAC